MGLDITAYSNLSPAPDEEVDEDGFPKLYDKYARADQETIDHTERNWPGRTEGLLAGIYSYSEAYKFKAGSYGGYNAWRSELSVVMTGLEAEDIWKSEAAKTTAPFYELISFSDCEGFIGPSVAAKLAGDFASHQAKATATGDDYFIARYADWRRAFELAADRGFVDFH